MRKRSGTKQKAHGKRSLKKWAYFKKPLSRRDALAEFETEDLGESIKKAGTTVVVRPQVMTSIRLDPALVQKLRRNAAKLGIGYQTLLKIIVTKHADDEI